MSATDGFSPDWVSAPGETISDILGAKKIPLGTFARSIGCSSGDAEDLIAGTIEITSDLAAKLAQVLGPSSSFWMTRESQYRSDLERTQGKRVVLRSASRHRLSDSSGTAFHAGAAFRTSPSFESQPEAVAAWLREGERKSALVNCRAWDAEKLERTLPALRSLTRLKNPSVFLPKLQESCSDCGVAVVIARTPAGCPASGATKFLAPEKAMMLLSFRYLSDDQFWFTFFHEAGHLLLHGMNALFVEGLPTPSDKDELEANQFSEQVLIPDAERAHLSSLKLDMRSIVLFARRIGISPGIVVGQLQHSGRVPRKHFNGLKVRFDWDQLAV